MSEHQKGLQKSRMRNGISLLLSFLLCLFMALMVYVLVLRCTLINASFLKQQVEKSKYPAYVTEELQSVFISYGMSSGFDEAFFMNALDVRRTANDVRLAVDQLYTPSAQGPDIEGFQNNLYEQLVENVKQRQIEITEPVDEALKYLSKVCADTYKGEVSLPFSGTISGVLQSVERPLDIALALLMLMCLIVLSFQFAMRRTQTFLRYLAYSAGGASLLLAVPALWLLLSGFIGRIGITSEALYNLVTRYIHQILYLLLLGAAALLALAVGAAIGFSVRKKREYHMYHKATPPLVSTGGSPQTAP